VKKEGEKTEFEVLTTTTLNEDTNFISPNPKIREKGVEIIYIGPE